MNEDTGRYGGGKGHDAKLPGGARGAGRGGRDGLAGGRRWGPSPCKGLFEQSPEETECVCHAGPDLMPGSGTGDREHFAQSHTGDTWPRPSPTSQRALSAFF